jgi:hypothetical protein
MAVTIDKHVTETLVVTPEVGDTVYLRSRYHHLPEGRGEFIVRARGGELMGAYVMPGEDLERVKWQFLSAWDEPHGDRSS